ncbi:hypothetical protein ASD79_10355 [Caulobacter sp. Root655]|jgi:hypothetical protein|uniref:hypothetical protein n=1 Tax=Caulobacter sp. Root655 TaxID=1736578 RepID=UPI0006FEB66D|nr:hypothetical protein [Caulobacter sp. Root655]KRA59921.1 hypothetical protein ASD79_10355 [Caulobacter sp. Root655]
MINILPTQLATLAMFAVCALALLLGRRFERLVAVATIAAWMLSAVVHGPDNDAVQWGIFTVDLVYLLVLIGFAVFDRPLWILFMAAFQLLVVLTHVVFMTDMTLKQWAFFSAYYLWSDAQLVALAVGVAQAWWGKRRAGRS